MEANATSESGGEDMATEVVAERRLTRSEVLERGTLSVEEFADFVGIGRSLAYKLVKTDAIETLSFGGRIVVLAQPLLKMLGALESLDEPIPAS